MPETSMIREMFEEVEASGYGPPARPDGFKEWFKRQAEGSLYFFCRFVLHRTSNFAESGCRDVAKGFHGGLCSWITSYTASRHKLLMVPVGHLKTTLVSHGLPIHVTIQPSDGDIYFGPSYTGGRGANVRIALGAENQAKAGENLEAIKENYSSNPWIVWCWPHLIWDNINEARPWSSEAIQLPRSRIWREPTITAYGIERAITGGHFDLIDPDDIATIAASQSPPLMEKTKTWLKRSFTRLHDRYESLHIGIGTHQGADDVYLEWEKRPTVETLKRAIEEKDEDGNLIPIWPERYTAEIIEKIKTDTDAITLALWYYNRPVASTFTAMDWNQLREFRWVGDNSVGLGRQKPMALVFDEGELDDLFRKQQEIVRNPTARFAHGLPLTPVQGNREKMIGRFFKNSMPQAQREYLRERYGGVSPATTPEKAALEAALRTTDADRDR